MATVTRENIGPLNDKLVVRVASDDYLPSFQKVLKDYSKKANIPGFRKGMVPVGMVKKMYGSSIFADEVIKSVEKGLQDYMEHEKLEIFAQPLPMFEDSPKMDMNEPAEYSFSFEVGLKPEFALPDPSSLHLTRYKIIVDDSMIDEQIERIRGQFTESQDTESVSSEENVVTLEFVRTDAEGNPLGEGTTYERSVSLQHLKADFRSQLMGKLLNDELLASYSDVYEKEENADLATQLRLPEEDESVPLFVKVKILKISLPVKAGLNEELFKKIYPDKENLNETDFRELIKHDLEEQWSIQSKNQLEDQIYHELLNHTQIDFPQDFLKRWMQRGMETPKTAEQVEEESPKFFNQLKWTLITDKLVEENNIEVGPQDLRENAKKQLLGYMGGNNMINRTTLGK